MNQPGKSLSGLVAAAVFVIVVFVVIVAVAIMVVETLGITVVLCTNFLTEIKVEL